MMIIYRKNDTALNPQDAQPFLDHATLDPNFPSDNLIDTADSTPSGGL